MLLVLVVLVLLVVVLLLLLLLLLVAADEQKLCSVPFCKNDATCKPAIKTPPIITTR
jgi:hypothetical protein